MNSQKIITGKYVSEDNQYVPYVSPLNSFVDVTSNLIEDKLQAYDVIKAHASSVILKPYNENDIKEELTSLKMLTSKIHKVEVKTFGNFDVFVGDTLVTFEREKSKELLAYLIDRRGSSVTTEQISFLMSFSPNTLSESFWISCTALKSPCMFSRRYSESVPLIPLPVLLFSMVHSFALLVKPDAKHSSGP